MRFTYVQIWHFYHLHDWRYVDFQTGHFVDFEQFDSHIAVFGQVKIYPNLLHFYTV